MLEVRAEWKRGKGGFTIRADFSLPENAFCALYGESGSGKTTLLRMIAGLVQPDTGRIQMGEETWFDSAKGIHLPVQKRSCAMMFQDYALFPHFTVRQNIEWATQGNQQSWVNHLLSETEMLPFAGRMPAQLSGGQKQRVALARALARKPRLLLLDEPLSALDLGTRQRLQDLLIRMQHEYALTILFVSHDIPEILRLSQRLIRMDQGNAVQVSGTESLRQEWMKYSHPEHEK